MSSPNSVYFLQENYSMMVLVTGVAYYYLLSFPREVDYIWCKPWARVSTLFVLVRYLGLCNIIAQAFFNFASIDSITTYALDPATYQLGCSYTNRCTAFYLVAEWTLMLFLASADLVMILRVYAMWDRSKIILGVLLLLYMLQTISTIVFYGMSNVSVTITQGLNTSFCYGVLYPRMSAWSIMIPHITFSLALFTLSVVQTLKQSLDIYKTTKQWQLSRYIKILVVDGILYYFVHLCYGVRTLAVWGYLPLSTITMDFWNASTTLLLLSMLPRFVISIRELYDRDVHRQQGIDSGLGILSLTPSRRTAFADVASGPMQEQTIEADSNGFGGDST